jgi:hypothetical protein
MTDRTCSPPSKEYWKAGFIRSHPLLWFVLVSCCTVVMTHLASEAAMLWFSSELPFNRALFGVTFGIIFWIQGWRWAKRTASLQTSEVDCSVSTHLPRTPNP